jgi:hypothetical protein
MLYLKSLMLLLKALMSSLLCPNVVGAAEYLGLAILGSGGFS